MRQAGRPLLSLAVLGYVETTVMMCNGPPGLGSGVLLTAGCLCRLVRRKQGEPLDLIFVSLAYGSTAILAITAFPGAWLIGGDWWFHLDPALGIARGTFGASPVHLARSAFHAAGSQAWLLAVDGYSLGGFQVWNALIAGAALNALRLATGKSGPLRPGVHLGVALALMVSPVFLICVQNLWPKFLAGALFWVSFWFAGRFRRDRCPRDLGFSAFSVAASFMAHESTVFYLPILVVRIGVVPLRDLLRRPGALGATLAIGLLGTVPWQIWTIVQFGWAARIEANPSVYWTSPSTWWWDIAQDAVDLLGGRFPMEFLHRLADAGIPWFGKAYYGVVAAVTVLGSTVWGLLLPCWIIRGPVLAALRRSWPNRMRVWAYAVAAAISFIGLGLVHPTGSPCGVLHGIFVQPVWLIYAAVAYALAYGGTVADCRRLGIIHAVLGFIPFLAVNLVLLVVLHSPGLSNLAHQLAARDADLTCMLHEGLRPLSDPPILIVAVAAALAFAAGKGATAREWE